MDVSKAESFDIFLNIFYLIIFFSVPNALWESGHSRHMYAIIFLFQHELSREALGDFMEV